MPRRSDARAKMIRSQALLQRERGVAGTALPDVIAHSGAPRGSIYHHFPEGRAQLAGEATELASEWIAGGLEQTLEHGGVDAALEAFVATWLRTLREHDFTAGCAVAAGALDAEEGSRARRAAAEGFARWRRLLTEALVRDGRTPPEAESLAVLCIAATEGALILARAERSTRPLELVADQLREHMGPDGGDRRGRSP